MRCSSLSALEVSYERISAGYGNTCSVYHHCVVAALGFNWNSLSRQLDLTRGGTNGVSVPREKAEQGL